MLKFFRNLPLAIFIAVPLTTFFYVFMNISYLTILSPSEILSSEAVAVVPSIFKRLPITLYFNKTLSPKDWARKLLGPFGFLMPLGVIISIFGSLNGGSVSGSRYISVLHAIKCGDLKFSFECGITNKAYVSGRQRRTFTVFAVFHSSHQGNAHTLLPV